VLGWSRRPTSRSSTTPDLRALLPQLDERARRSCASRPRPSRARRGPGRRRRKSTRPRRCSARVVTRSSPSSTRGPGAVESVLIELAVLLVVGPAKTAPARASAPHPSEREAKETARATRRRWRPRSETRGVDSPRMERITAEERAVAIVAAHVGKFLALLAISQSVRGEKTGLRGLRDTHCRTVEALREAGLHEYVEPEPYVRLLFRVAASGPRRSAGPARSSMGSDDRLDGLGLSLISRSPSSSTRQPPSP
jgi:hypothetical protein